MLFLVPPKREATHLRGVPLSRSLTTLNLIFKDLSKCWCFAAEMALCRMYDMHFCRKKKTSLTQQGNIIRRSIFDLTFHLAKTLYTRLFFRL